MSTKTISIIIAALLCGVCFGQAQPKPQNTVPPSNKVIRKIKIKHADPYLIWLLLNGKTTFTTPPEITAIKKQRG